MAEPKQPSTRPPTVLEDPSAQAVARVYAKAFLRAATETGGGKAMLSEYASFLDDVLARNPEFDNLLKSGLLGRDEKLSLIDRVVAPYATPIFTSFLRVLARHDRLDLLPLIFRESERRFEESEGKKRVQVTSAKPLSDGALERIRQRLAEVFKIEPVIQPSVDESLLGGLVIQVGDTVYDTSLRTRLKQLRGRLLRRSYNEIQSGRDRFSNPEGN